MEQKLIEAPHLVSATIGGLATVLSQWALKKLRCRVTGSEAIVLYRASVVGGMLSRDSFLPGWIILRFQKPGNDGELLPLNNVRGELFSLLEKGHIVAEQPPYHFRLTTQGWNKVNKIRKHFDDQNPSTNPKSLENPSWWRKWAGW